MCDRRALRVSTRVARRIIAHSQWITIINTSNMRYIMVRIFLISYIFGSRLYCVVVKYCSMILLRRRGSVTLVDKHEQSARIMSG
jgi:hypothetical protein